MARIYVCTDLSGHVAKQTLMVSSSSLSMVCENFELVEVDDGFYEINIEQSALASSVLVNDMLNRLQHDEAVRKSDFDSVVNGIIVVNVDDLLSSHDEVDVQCELTLLIECSEDSFVESVKDRGITRQNLLVKFSGFSVGEEIDNVSDES